MAMMDFEKQKEVITTANQFDVCTICANELAKDKGISLNNAKLELEGHIVNQQVIKFSEVTTTVICSSCIAKFNARLNPAETKAEAAAEVPVQSEAKEVKKNEAKSTKTKK